MELKQRQNSSLFRLIALAMAVCMLSSAFLERAASAATSPADIRGAWSERILLEWMNKGWLTGYPDGTVKPKLEVTRAEFFSLANKSLGFVDEAVISFSDIKPGSWKAKQAAIAVQAGYAEGYPDGTMQPDRKITREEVSIMVAKAFDLKLSPEETAVFKDAASISNSSKGAVGALVAGGILKGYLDGTFRPKKVITREEAVVILDGALKKLERGSDKDRTFSAAGAYGPASGTETIAGNVVVATSGVTLRNMEIQGNLLLSTNIGEGEATLDNVKVKGTVTVNGGGPNSIYLENSQLEILIVDKKNGNVRIVAKGSTTVKRVDLRSGAKLESDSAKDKGFKTVHLTKEMPSGSKVILLGEFAEANVASSKVELKLIKGKIEKLNVLSGASGNTVNLEEDTRVVDLTLEEETKVQGQGVVDRAVIGERAKDTKFERVPGKLEGDNLPPPSSGGGGGGGGNQDTTPPAAPVVVGVQDQGFYAGPVTPNWSDASGTTSTATLTKDGSVKTSYTRNTEIAEDGSYILNVTARKNSNGRTTATTIRFTIDSTGVVPAVIEGVEEGGTYYSAIVAWVDSPGMNSTATLAKDGGAAASFYSGTEITEEGDYVLILTTRNALSNETAEQQIHFTIDASLPHPIITGFADNGIYFDTVMMIWEPSPGANITGASLRNVATGEVTDNISSPTTLSVDGTYALSLNVERDGTVVPYVYQFMIVGIRGLNDGETYQSVTPNWVEPIGFGGGSRSEAVLSRNGARAVPYTKGTTIDEDGDYELMVAWYTRNNSSATYSVNFTIRSNHPVPANVAGVADGNTYVTATVTWTDAVGMESEATLAKDGAGAVPYASGTVIDEDGQYVLIVTTRNVANGLTVQQQISFTIDSLPPGVAEIAISGEGRELAGVMAYYTAELAWSEQVGTTSTAMLHKDGAEPVPYAKGTFIDRDGEYELIVTTTKLSNGLTSTATRAFHVNTGPVQPVLSGFSDNSILFGPAEIAWTPHEGTQIDWVRLQNLNTNESDEPSNPTTLEQFGEYEFSVGVRKGGEIDSYDYRFIVAGFSGIEEGGVYANATPDWFKPQHFGEVSAILTKDSGSPIPYLQGETIYEPGDYVLTVIWRIDEGNSELRSIRFTIEPASTEPHLIGFSADAVLFSGAEIAWEPRAGTLIDSINLFHRNTNTTYTRVSNPTTIDIAGEYMIRFRVIDEDGEKRIFDYTFIVAEITDVEEGGVYSGGELSRVKARWFVPQHFGEVEAELTKDGSPIPYSRGTTLKELGNYVLTVTWRSNAGTPVSKSIPFTIVPQPPAPVLSGLSDNAILFGPAEIAWAPGAGTEIWSIQLDHMNTNTTYVNNPNPRTIDVAGEYVFRFAVRQDGVDGRHHYQFMVVEISGVAEGGVYSDAAPQWYEPQYFGTAEATLAKDGGPPTPYAKGTPITEAGEYVLTVTWRIGAGSSETKSIRFTIEPASSAPHLIGFSGNAVLFNGAEIAWEPRAGTQINRIDLMNRSTSTTYVTVPNPKTLDVAGEYVMSFRVNGDGEERIFEYQFIVAEITDVEEGGVYPGGEFSKVKASWFEPKLFGEVEAELTKDGSPIPYSKGTTLREIGNYVLTVTWSANAGTPVSKSIPFTIVPPPPAPALSGLSDNAILFGPAEIAWTPSEGTQMKSATLDHRNSSTYTMNLTSPRIIDVAGEYVLKFEVSQDGLTGEHHYQFMVVEISGVAEGGVYSDAAPQWYEPKYFGAVEAVLAKDGGSPIPYSKGETISEPGEYVLTVTWRIGAGSSETKSIRFTIED